MYQCPNCNRSQPSRVAICDCGYNLEKYREQLRDEAKKQKNASRPYRWLPIFRWFLRITGILTIISGIINAYALIINEMDYAIILASFVLTIIAVIALFSYAEVITVLLDLNTQNREILLRLENADDETGQTE